MKISASYVLLFVCSLYHCKLDPTQNTFIIENIETNSSISEPSENATNEEINFIGEESGLESSIQDVGETSIKDKDSYYAKENDLLEVAQNSGVSHEVTSPNLEIIHTLADSATLELQEKAEELSAAPTDSDASQNNSNSNLENNIIGKPDVDNDILEIQSSLQDHEFKYSDVVNQTEQFLHKVPSTEPKINITDKNEEIPSFSEWAQKQLEEAERKKEEVNASVQSQLSNGKLNLSGKKRWKNYASPDCGAKIFAANPEAGSAANVLTVSRDEYILNTCASRIWFVVELCEAIQAKRIEMANFELFSSSPKDFSISVSDRFTSRDWSNVGHFTAKDERDIQSFDLFPHIFGKFIKFEMHSHHGSEHYCPISLFRVFGTSEFEVLETENQVNSADDDDEDDEALDSEDGEPPKNLFSSATDAVISIVKKAAEALGNKGNHSKTVQLSENKTGSQYLPLVNSCTTPSHMVICENCTDLLFGYVFELLSCKSKELTMLIHRKFIKKTLYNTDICMSFGLDWRKKNNTPPLPHIYKKHMIAFFPPKYIAAMCNTVAIAECLAVLNISHNATIIPQNIENTRDGKLHEILQNITVEVTMPETPEIASTVTSHSSDIPDTSQIKPTKTLTPDENLIIADSSDADEDDINKQFSESKENLEDRVEQFVSIGTEDQPITQEINQADLNISDEEPVPENVDDTLETFVTEINEESTPTVPTTTTSPPTQPQQQKESVFMRLSNRLKALELNMSLSGQYLEELSRRYKKQVEEMQRLLDKTILSLNEDNRKKDDRAEHLEQQLHSLQETVASLIEERNSWVNIVYSFIFIVTVTATVLFCKRNSDCKQPTIDGHTNNSEIFRRKSISVITHKTPKKKRRRPSEEALMINGTYKNLLINNDVGITARKKRKKQKSKLIRSNSVSGLTDKLLENDNRHCKTIGCASKFLNCQEETALSLPPQWLNKSTHTFNEINNISFVLEDSEHSSLEPLPQNSITNGNPERQSKFTVTPVLLNSNHKKADSLDDSKSIRTLSSPTSTYESSLNGSLPDDTLAELPRREKKNIFKKIFKNLSMK